MRRAVVLVPVGVLLLGACAGDEDDAADTSARGVHKLDLPCNKANSAATADIITYGTDHAEKLRG
jgi:hypothetical protein